MQNKANLLNTQMNVSSFKTMSYEQKTMNYANKKQTQTKPISKGRLAGKLCVNCRGACAGALNLCRLSGVLLWRVRGC